MRSDRLAVFVALILSGIFTRFELAYRNRSQRTTTRKVPPASPRASSPSVPIVTSPTMTKSISTTTVIPLFQQKPLLICHLVSPGYFARGSDRDEFLNQEVPSATICDYTLLDLPLLPDGTYEDASYNFMNSVRDHRLLFNADLDPTDANQSLVTARSVQFRNSIDLAQMDLHPNKIYGLGFIKGLPYLKNTGGGPETKAYLNDVYKSFSQVLMSTHVSQDDVRHFFAFKPDRDVIRYMYFDYLSLLNSINGLSIVIILTITDERMLEVMPSSSWDYKCLTQPNQTTMYDTVYEILQIPSPKVNFTLTISLRLDGFHGVSLGSLATSSLNVTPVSFHNAVSFSAFCYRQFFQQDPTGADIVYIGNKGCAFASGKLVYTVISFDTPATVRKKMIETYRFIKYPRTSKYVVGWTVYNVTSGLAPRECLGHHNRIREIRKVIDDNRYP